MKKVVVIGGGTGTFTVLSGLKKYKDLELSVIVTMMDDGGSNRVIRDEFGLLPTSDLRQCMVALASEETDEILRKLFTYRFTAGVGISGMTFGNLFMAALADIYEGNQKKAIEATCGILGVSGKIIPVTYDKVHLVATYANGKQVMGEHDIDEPSPDQGKYKITHLEIFPKAQLSSDAAKAIVEADLIVLGPGDFYTSILPNIVVEGMKEKISSSKARIVYVLNLMTKFGQTVGFEAGDFLDEMNNYLGSGRLDFCVINNSKKYPEQALEKYKKEEARPVPDNLGSVYKGIKVIRKDVVSDLVFTKSESDKLIRSLIRHDSDKLAKVVVGLL